MTSPLLAYRRSRLKTKLALWSTLAMVVIVLSMTLLALWMLRSDVMRNASAAQAALIDGVATELDEKLEMRRQALAVSAAVLRQMNLKDGAALRGYFATRPLLQSMFDVLVVTDSRGQVLFDAPEFPGRSGSSMADNPHFQSLLKTGNLTISSPVVERSTNEPSIMLLMPLRDGEGRTTGMLGGIIYLTRPNFLTALSSARIGQGGHFVLITKDAQPAIITHRARDRIMTPAPTEAEDPELHAALRGDERTVESSHMLGLPAITSYRGLRTAPWLLTAVYPVEEAFAGAQRRERSVLAAGAGLTLVFGLGMLLLAGRLLAPLGRLQREMLARRDDGSSTPISFADQSRDLVDVVDAYNAVMQHRAHAEAALRSSERRLQTITDNLPALIAYVDKQQKYCFANAYHQQVYGLPPQKMLGRSVASTLNPQAYAEIAPKIAAVLRGEPCRFERHATERGLDMYFQIDYIPDRAADGSVAGFYVMVMDITARKKAELSQGLSERRLRAVTDNLPALVSHFDAELRCTFSNPYFGALKGMDPRATIGLSARELWGEADYPRLEPYLLKAMRGQKSSFEHTTTVDGSERCFQQYCVPDLGASGAVQGFYSMSFDITTLKQVERQLNDLARIDTLTQLPNRRRFEEKLPEALARGKRGARPLALMLLDVDHFKTINDTHGHGVGDAVLKEFGQRLLANVRATDTVARLGGDEFVIILEDVRSAEEAALVAQKIVDGFRRPVRAGLLELAVSSSIGVAFVEPGPADARRVIERADEALYQAKDGGRNQYALLTL